MNLNCLSRRHFLAGSTMGLGGAALAWLLHQDGLLAAPTRPELEPRTFDLSPRQPHHPPKARAMISMFMQGGPSHIDLLDRKPELERRAGQPYPGELRFDSPKQVLNQLFPSPWPFRRYGQSGTEISTLLPHLGSVIDDVCVVRSMRTAVNNHVQSAVALNTGRILAGRPVLGSWLTYGLGNESQNLPAYMVLPDVTLPVVGVDNWSNGWLPSIYQGTVVRNTEPRILNLDPAPHMRGEAQGRFLNYLEQLNREHLDRHPGQSELEARLASYALAARMQTAASEALDLTRESAATKRLYGFDDPACRDFAERCLIARRLVERGVRFVQLCTGNQFWDHHGNIATSLPRSARKIDQPSAALVYDLKARGLLDTTLVAWGGEMGRLPVVQNANSSFGRDHNTYGFSMWFAGGGIKGGTTYGATDDFGYNAVHNVVHHYDYQATILHLFGLDHRRLVFRRNNQELTLTDNQPARVVHDILA
ncbi:MAG: DUF1501 domain-containing protein [Gemmataceae bacterium]|nr:DUF1501 domain-containing protein [Gemmataceae bacterium]